MSTDERTVERFRKVGQVETIDGSEVACQCYTQQDTRSKTSVQFCVDAVNNGIFDDTRQTREIATATGMTRDSSAQRRGSAASAATNHNDAALTTERRGIAVSGITNTRGSIE